MAAFLTIPGIGTFRPTFDAINICTEVPKDQLGQLLPIEELERRSHSFKIEKRHGKRGSRLKIVCLPDKAVLKLLQKHEAALGSYWVNKVEAAFDIDARSEKTALLVRDWLLRHLGKINHERGYIGFVSKAKKGPRLTAKELKRRGLFDHPTIYFEHDKAAHNLKIYIRRRKLALGQFGSIIAHLEWTSKGGRAVRTHFGGDQLSDLINANLESYLHRFLILEQIDYVKLGKLLAPRTVMRHAKLTSSNPRANAIPVTALFRDADYRASRVAHLAIKVLEQREWPQIEEVRSVPEEVWRSSPAQIKGRFRDAIRKMQAKRHAKKPAKRRLQRHPLTMKKLQTCFTKISLRRNRVRLRK
ncbi:hypothetical protein [Mesorhizobium sp. LNJC394B00]|uniref:hypothetical protein n=1 Tax=Mesorhizobium sp. LNJC394B00 TaxID=1287274 RepID=UPI0003CF6D81|nr:hypothetical protein [Mesorhizobium sp. LNJC394B00]ESY24256.1 hypothetical protein X750_05215 [Mesorhizobium sp. LNJC394B00]